MARRKSGILGEIIEMGTSPMIGASFQIGMGSMAATVPGTPAAATLTTGQAAVGNIFRMYPAKGTLVGTKALVGTTMDFVKMAKKFKL